VVAKAKVPIVKLVIMPYGLKFDISIGKTNGLDAVNLIQGHLAAWPVLRPLVTILKLYLLQRNMNEVYSGGFGSFALITSVVAFLQMHQSRVRGLAGELMITVPSVQTPPSTC
jgi:non-canonical poly(A) RNA polymerase PAPD5/7